MVCPLYLREMRRKPETILFWKVGNIYAERNEWDLAMKHYNEALELSKTFENIKIPEIYRGIGRVKWRNGDFSTAIDYFDKTSKRVFIEIKP